MHKLFLISMLQFLYMPTVLAQGLNAFNFCHTLSERVRKLTEDFDERQLEKYKFMVVNAKSISEFQAINGMDVESLVQPIMDHKRISKKEAEMRALYGVKDTELWAVNSAIDIYTLRNNEEAWHMLLSSCVKNNQKFDAK